MSGLSQGVVAVLLVWSFAFFRLPLWGWTALAGGCLFLFTSLGWIGLSAWVLWPLFLGLSVFLNVTSLRQQYLMEKILNWFKGNVIALSATEKEMIEAGDVGFEKGLFQGKLDWKQLLDLPPELLTSEEKNFLNTQVETLCGRLNEKNIHENNGLSEQVWQYLKAERFFGLIIPKNYGGLGFSSYAHSAIMMKINTRSISAALSMMASLLPTQLLIYYGNEKQKAHFLPRLATGDEIPCFALSSLEVENRIIDKGIVCKGVYQNQEIIGIRLNLDERSIHLAPVATLIGVAFKLFDPDHLLGDKTELGVTLAFIPANYSGVQIKNHHFPLNRGLISGTISANDSFIPMDWIIGGRAMMGLGWRMLVECWAAGGGISIPSFSTAGAMVAYRTSSAYTLLRKSFNRSMGWFEAIQTPLARVAGYTYLLEAMRLLSTQMIDQKKCSSVASAIAKYQMSEIARKAVNDAMGVTEKGIMMDAYQALPISMALEGTHILTRGLAIFGQSAFRCHPYLKALTQCVEIYDYDPKAALAQFDHYALKQMGYFVSNVARCFAFSLSQGHLVQLNIKDKTALFAKQITWLSTALAVVSDLVLGLFGNKIKHHERLCTRLGDVLGHLYLGCAVLKYYQKDPSHWLLAQWGMHTCLYQAQEAFYAVFQNFPHRIVGKLLKWLIFPYGRAFSKPSDELEKKMVEQMLTLNAFREQLAQWCYQSKNSDDRARLMEVAFHKLVKAQPLLEKIDVAVMANEIDKNLPSHRQIEQAFSKKLINQSEFILLQELEKIRKKVLLV